MMHYDKREGQLTVELPIYARSEANSRDHWAKRSKRTGNFRAGAKLALNWARKTLAEWLADGRVAVRMVRIHPKRYRPLDDDNLRGSLKAVRDGIADAMGLTDDSDARIEWEYDQQPTEGTAFSVAITLKRIKRTDAE